MRQRVMSGAVIILVSGILLFASGSPVFTVVISLLCVLAVYEMFAAAKYTADRALLIICAAFAAAVPFFPLFKTWRFAFIAILVFILCMLALFLVRWQRGIEKIGFAFMMSVLIPAAYSTMIGLRDLYLHSGLHYVRSDGTLFLVLVLLGAWGTDVGGLLAGSLFGKHKLAPTISPKKTVEGALGGIVLCFVGFLLAVLVYVNFWAKDAKISYAALVVLSVLCACGAMFGDLAASAAKRSFHVKDFGNLIPGHGGILDRFDSVLLVSPILFIFLQIVPVIKR